MNSRVVFAVIAAQATGVAISLQASLNGRIGNLVGPIRTGLMVNAAGGTMALLLLLLLTVTGASGLAAANIRSEGLILPIVAAGILGLLIIMGVAFSVQNVGVTAGLAAVILTQLVGGLFLDSTGIVDGTGISVDPRRILGIAAMGVGVWLLIPRGA